MGKVIAVFNQKGGVGKTTTNVNLTASLGAMGKKILVLDLDPQGNTTSGYGIDKQSVDGTIYDVIIDGVDINETILNTEFENIDIVASDTDLAGCEIELTSRESREYILKNSIDKVRDNYDYIFIDCPPSLGMLTINSLTAVDSVLIPIQCEYYALEGLGQLLNTVNLVKKHLNKNFDIEGALLTMYDMRTNLSNQVVKEVNNYFGDKVYKTVIPRNVKLSEAPSYGMPITVYDPRSKGARSYEKFVKEFLKKNEISNNSKGKHF